VELDDGDTGVAAAVVSTDLKVIDGVNHHEIWPLIIERAYTILVGGPPNVGGVLPSVAYEWFTGVSVPAGSIKTAGEYSQSLLASYLAEE